MSEEEKPKIVNPIEEVLDNLLEAYKLCKEGEISEKEVKKIEEDYKYVVEIYKFTTG